MSCPACFTGAVHHDERPINSIKTVHGRQTYVADPPNGAPPKGIIVIVPDAFGLPFINNQILADNYARKGQFKVYLPDFMDGWYAPLWVITTMPQALETKTIWDWVRKPYDIAWLVYAIVPFFIMNRYGISMPRVEKFLSDVRQNEGADLPIGVAGFCWGGQHAVRLAHSEAVGSKLLADVSFTAHPSLLTIPDDFAKVKRPLSIAVGSSDVYLSVKQCEEVEAVLKAKPGLNSEVVIYQGAGHGFSVRADLGNEQQSRQAQEAEDQAVKFFTENFKARK